MFNARHVSPVVCAVETLEQMGVAVMEEEVTEAGSVAAREAEAKVAAESGEEARAVAETVAAGWVAEARVAAAMVE